MSIKKAKHIVRNYFFGCQCCKLVDLDITQSHRFLIVICGHVMSMIYVQLNKHIRSLTQRQCDGDYNHFYLFF